MIEDRVFSVYIHKFPNGKQYVGITSIKPKTRWKNGNGYKKNKIMYEDIQKYGWNNIEHILFNDEGILYDEEEACYIEKCLIDSWDLLNPEKGYNLRTGGTSSYNQHKNTRKKISESAKKNKINSKAVIQYSLECKKMAEYSSAVEAGKKLKIDASSITKCCRGKLKSAGKFLWQHKFNEQNNIKPQSFKGKVVIQYTFDNLYLNEFSTIKEAEKKLHINGICACCKGKQKFAGGYIWKYKE